VARGKKGDKKDDDDKKHDDCQVWTVHAGSPAGLAAG
jgi:hypothetical protein